MDDLIDDIIDAGTLEIELLFIEFEKQLELNMIFLEMGIYLN